jgi:uracil-DNA glycosylase
MANEQHDGGRRVFDRLFCAGLLRRRLFCRYAGACLSGAGSGSHEPTVLHPPRKSLRHMPSAEQRMRAAEQRMHVLDRDIVSCTQCPRLISWCSEVAREKRAAFRDDSYWGKPVPGFGSSTARLLVLGLAPAAHGANRTGRVFTGDRSGDWLFRALHKAGFANQATSSHRGDGLELQDCRVAAAVRCAPPGNAPTPEERDACSPFLERELQILTDLRVILVLGSFAYQAAAAHLGIRPRPKFGHGVEVSARLPNGTSGTVLCSYHPSQQNTFTGTLTEAMLDDVVGRCSSLVYQ